MSRSYALVKNGVVVNTIDWDGLTEGWEPAEDIVAVLIPVNAGGVSIGWVYRDNAFSAPD